MNQSSGRFGMFAGVFTPNILTILGIILFLRIGWVVGQVGMWGALVIVVVANAISLLTGLSLSSIATSMQVRAGGNYYLISRTLGLEVGGAIGIPLYLSQAISVAFYIIGFTEALTTLEAMQSIDPRLISTAVALLFGVNLLHWRRFCPENPICYFSRIDSGYRLLFCGGLGRISSPADRRGLHQWH